ncbi:Steroid 5 alpha-reductase 3 [Coemansia javaensis]|uniref:Steroid 5 alpha-reductase 3 n=1 Tax=Coemansia javaensis TaxID=2761396 RepID=A0A9W8HFG4_9FUNG|nr:Steroid 5 alpha-reductase 3 [Coemansia javaensis]
MLICVLLRALYGGLAALAAAFALAPWTRDAFVRYGKTRRAGGRAAGALARAASMTVPKNWFAHFYYVGAATGAVLALDMAGWGWPPAGLVLWAAALLERLGGGGGSGSSAFAASPGAHTGLVLALYNTHVAVRLAESVASQPATDAAMHVGQYGVGLVFYVATPLALAVDSCAGRGWSPVPLWMALAGTALFAYASVHQWRCHRILFRLRRKSLQAARGGSQPYAVPSGDLFALVSCPHFLCEILIYVSLWIATGAQATTAQWVVFWTTVNLGITARESHRWYRATFGPRYPRARRALVPFVW